MHTLEDNINMDLKQIGYKYDDWVHLALDRNQWRAFVNIAMKFLVS